MDSEVFICIQHDAKADTTAPWFVIEKFQTMNGPRFRVVGRYKLLSQAERAAHYPDKIEDPACADAT